MASVKLGSKSEVFFLDGDTWFASCLLPPPPPKKMELSFFIRDLAFNLGMVLECVDQDKSFTKVSYFFSPLIYWPDR